MSPQLTEAFARLPAYLGGHVAVSVTALLLADRIAVMRNGRVVADGTPQALMNGKQDDYVRELMATPRRQAERLKQLSAS